MAIDALNGATLEAGPFTQVTPLFRLFEHSVPPHNHVHPAPGPLTELPHFSDQPEPFHHRFITVLSLIFHRYHTDCITVFISCVPKSSQVNPKSRDLQ